MLDPTTAFRECRTAGAGWSARCPAHDDQRSSLSIGLGDDGRVLVKCHAGCDLDAILAAAHLEHADLFPTPATATTRTTIATYRYEDQGGQHLFDVVRFAPKDFRQRRADGVWKMAGVRRVLYRLPELQGQTVVYVVEGEKDADRLRTIGLPGTTNAGGAGKWKADYAAQLTAAGVESVVILPDNDPPGRAHAADIAASCHAAGLKVKTVALPHLPAKGDVSDWLDAGHTRDELVTLVKATALDAPHDVPSRTDDLALTPLHVLLSEPDDAVEWLVEGLIASGSVNMLAGKPKAGKSTLARQLAYCLAIGTPFIGRACLGGLVWYLVLEDKRAEVRRHFRTLGATGTEPVRFLFGSTKDLMGKLARLAERERPNCIIVDTLQRLIFAKDLNDYAEVTTRLDPVLAIARSTAAAILLVHHAAKADRAGVDQVLGSTALTGSVDNVFLLNRTDRYRVLSSVQRIGADLEETVLTLDDTGRARSGQSRHEADLEFVERAMLHALTVSAGLTRPECLDAVEGRKQIKLEALRRLVESGTTIRTGTGKKNDPYRYHVGDCGSVVPYKSGNHHFSPPAFKNFPTPAAQNGGSRDLGLFDGGSHEAGTTISDNFPQAFAADGGSRVEAGSGLDAGSHLKAGSGRDGWRCCEGGALQPRCKLCRQSPTYWQRDAHQGGTQ